LTLSREPSQSVSINLEKQNRRAIFWIIFLFAFLLFALSAIAVYTYVAQIHRLTAESQSTLTMIYQNKIQAITVWRDERIGDAQVIKRNTMMANAAKHLAENPGDTADQIEIISWLTVFLEAYDYESFEIFNTVGDLLLAHPEGNNERSPETQAAMEQALSENRPILSDLYLSTFSENTYLDLVIPLDDPSSLTQNPVAICILHINANVYLYPALQTWPVPSSSGETILFRRDGDKVTYLNTLRFVEDSALKYQYAVDDPNLPAAQIARGDLAIGEGVDYRGVRVFYGGAQIPKSNWYLLAKIDRDEVFAEVRRQGWALTGILMLIMMSDLSLAFALVRRQQAIYKNKLLEIDKNREEITERYSALFEGGNDIIFLVDEQGNINDFNDRAIDAYGYSENELRGLPIMQLRIPSNQLAVKDFLDNVKAKGSLRGEFLHHRKDGTTFPVEASIRHFFLDGRDNYLDIVRDITERMKIENALKENLSDLQSIIDTSPLALITTDINGVVTLWNRAATQMFGWQADEVIGKELAYFPVDKGDDLKAVLQKIHHAKGALVYETVRNHKDGRHLNVKVHATAIHDYKGEIKGSLAIISDETELKMIEAANLAMQEERNSLLHRLQLQFQNMPVGFLLTDENLDVVDWNPAAERIFGYSREEMIGRSEYGTIIPMDQKQTVQNVIGHSISHNQTIVSRNENLHKDGHRIIVEWHNTPLRDESGTLIAMMNMAVDVTEKVEADNKLRESEEKLRGFFESNLIGIVWASLDGQVYTANDAFLDLVGYSRQELEAGQVNWASITPTEFIPLDKASIQKARRDGACLPYEKQYLRKDGSLIWVLIGFVVIGENKDQSIAFALDISERKKAEEELARSEIRYSSLFKNMINGVAQCKMIYDEKGNEIDYINLRVNDTFEKLTGLKDIEGKRITEVIPNIRHDNPELFEVYGRVARTGKPESFETFVPGLGVYYSINVYSPERGYFTVVFDDITVRKTAELEIRSKQELLNLTGSIAKVGGWEFDPKTGKGNWTDEVARIHDLDPADPTTVEIGTSYYHGENKKRIEKAIKAASENGSPYDLELELISAKGVRKIVRTIGQPEMQDGKVVKVRGIFQDITELKKAEAEVKALNESLEQRVRERTDELQIANQELEAFTYSVSHDLRAPLRAIDGFSQIIINDYSDDTSPDVLRYLALIRKNTQNMGHLVDDLLAFSRLGKQTVNKEKVNVTRLVKEIAAEIKSQEPKRKIRFIVAKMPDCMADESLLKQVYINLLSNAAKFTRSRTPALIEAGICNARPRHTDGSLGDETSCHYVRDNGVGFDMRYYDKLFGVFQRLHSADEYEGTGVGLAIVQRVIEKHNGTIWAESKIDAGTTFYFTLGEEKNDDKPN
jgi:PAS domain S-box-containing protein